MTRLPTSAVLLAILASAGAAAQREQEKPAEEVFREEIEVTEVLLDVVVTDKRDRIILGLGQGDFIVEEDGRAVDLSSVTFYSSKRLLESSSPRTEVPGPKCHPLGGEIEAPRLQNRGRPVAPLLGAHLGVLIHSA